MASRPIERVNQPPLAVLLTTGVLLIASMAAAPVIATDSLVTIGNVAPLVVSVSLPEEVSPLAGSSRGVSTTIVVEDLNGCDDINTVEVTVLKPDDSVHIAATQATFQSCTLGTSATYSHSFDMAFHDAPALDTTFYKVRVVATDDEGATGSNIGDLALFNYNELVAMNVGAATIEYGGPLDPGDESSIITLSLQNHGNVAINTELSGTDMAHATEAGVTIPVGSTAYSLNADMSGSSALSTNAASVATAIAPGAAATASVYWQLTIPSGGDQWVPSGDYTGEVTLSAVKAT